MIGGSCKKSGQIAPLTNLANRLGLEWGKHYSSITGIRSLPSEIGDMEFFGRKMKSRPF